MAPASLQPEDTSPREGLNGHAHLNGHVHAILTPRQKGVAKLRAMLNDPKKTVVCPGIYDGLTARIALRERFECLYMTGAGTSASRLGMADLGLVSLSDMKDNAEMIANLDLDVPLIADADTGYGGSTMVGRTVAQYIRAGVAGFHIEDQVVNKRCGHLANKQLVSEDVFLSRIRACVNMRRDLGQDIVIIARTDALASLGYDAAISRLKTAVAAGADAVLLEAIETVDQAKEVCKTMAPTPVMYGMVQGSSTPHLSVKEAEECGIRILVYAGVALAPVLESVTKAMRRLKTEGTVERNTPKARELFSVCGLNELVAFDQAAGGDLYTKGA